MLVKSTLACFKDMLRWKGDWDYTQQDPRNFFLFHMRKDSSYWHVEGIPEMTDHIHKLRIIGNV